MGHLYCIISLVFLIVLIVVIPALAQFSNGDCCENYCLDTDKEPFTYFGTKTTYALVYGKNAKDSDIPHCDPKLFWSVNRHGTRYPSKKSIIELREKIPKLKYEIVGNYEMRRTFPDVGKLCDQDFDKIKRWRWDGNVAESQANYLTEQGRDDMRYLAKRFSVRFPDIIKPYNNQYYDFQYTSELRTKQSFESFTEGLFGDNNNYVKGIENDAVLRPHRTCQGWLDKNKDPQTKAEMLKFEQTPEYINMVKDISTRLGYKYILNSTSIHLMYDMCRYENAWNSSQNSAWCAVFTKKQLKLLEYHEDLEDYYKSGYGHEYNKKLGCPLIRDMMNFFVTNMNSDHPKLSAQFTHSAAIQMFLTAMDFQKDPIRLESENYNSMDRRKWRTSLIDPFAANVAVIYYECSKGEKNVMFLLNERPIEHPDCRVGLCPWEKVYSRLKPIADDCNFDFCIGGTSNVVISILSLILPATMFILY